jgi:prephenate dehydratase
MGLGHRTLRVAIPGQSSLDDAVTALQDMRSVTKLISFQGEPGAFSHKACAEARPGWVPLPCPTFEDTFAAVAEGRAELAMVPIENSTAGRVSDVHHLLPNSGLNIVDEHFLPIHSQSMAWPEADLATIDAAQSHIHAIGQCRKIVRKLGLKAMVNGDTAGPTQHFAESGNTNEASLSSRLTADLDGLRMLAEDDSHSTTRFIILSKTPKWAPATRCPVVTSFVFRVRNLPAALYKALGGFATNEVNMTKLESYILAGDFRATQFYAEVDGHPEDASLNRALEELEFFSSELRILGVYPASPFRLLSPSDATQSPAVGSTN